ncbi:MAG: hypothetical protein JW996_05605 [Candidatus Cloacimonetes bacterium]|nr:hypothetical protein [Candidatus Cloacimonadota bacterium]
MAIPILKTWKRYFLDNPDEGLGSSYERIIINDKLSSICKQKKISTVLEVPLFGFTGLSGINSMELARQGMKITIADNDRERIDLIERIWRSTGLKAEILYLKKFSDLFFPADTFDLAWNYSALWFVDDLAVFLDKLTSCVSQVIMFCVPNKTGLGYLSQKYISGADLRKYLEEDNIRPAKIKNLMHQRGWKLVEKGYFDNPPWPDIGMSKEELLQLFGLKFLIRENRENRRSISIMDYYRDKDPDFREKMMKYSWLEQISPKFVKFFWSHHKYLVFEPE